MIFVSKLGAILLLAWLSVSGAQARDEALEPGDDLAAAETLYAAGDFAAASRMALGVAEAVGDALAARALLAEVRMVPREERAALVQQAHAAAQSAIERDAGQIEGHLQLAVVLGFEGRAMGNFAAHQKGLAEDARTAIDAALALSPDNAWARALSGTWHLEIVSGAGPIMAIALYGANRSDGLADIRAAVATPDSNAIIRHQCALQLLAHDSDIFGAEAERMLVAALSGPRGDAFQKYTTRQADKLLRAYRTGNASLLKREIERQQGGY